MAHWPLRRLAAATVLCAAGLFCADPTTAPEPPPSFMEGVWCGLDTAVWAGATDSATVTRAITYTFAVDSYAVEYANYIVPGEYLRPLKNIPPDSVLPDTALWLQYDYGHWSMHGDTLYTASDLGHLIVGGDTLPWVSRRLVALLAVDTLRMVTPTDLLSTSPTPDTLELHRNCGR